MLQLRTVQHASRLCVKWRLERFNDTLQRRGMFGKLQTTTIARNNGGKSTRARRSIRGWRCL